MASLMAKYIKKYAIIQHHRVICQLILNILKILWNVIYLITNKIPEIKERIKLQQSPVFRCQYRTRKLVCHAQDPSTTKN